jgi:hypothetical protein
MLVTLALAAFAQEPAPKLTVNVNSLVVDGLEVRALQCSLAAGGLLAPVLVVGTLAQNKPALDACAPAGAAVDVTWRWEVGATRDVKSSAGPTPTVDACVTTVMSGLAPAQASLVGTCTARVLIGDPVAAKAAADARAAAP